MSKNGSDDALHDVDLSCEIDNMAIPEIHTGQVEEVCDLDCPEDVRGICYDTVAVPEIYISGCLNCSRRSSLRRS